MEEEMDFENRILTPEYEREDSDIEGSLRPKTLQEYIGQEKAKENMSIYIEAARMRGEPLDHVLLYGPPGLGKTTLSGIIANEMNVNLRITSGPAIENPGKMTSCLLMRFTGCRVRWKRCFIQRWRTTRWILSSAKARQPGRFGSICPILH